MSNRQTDNDSIGFSYKVALRSETAKEGQRILDCYHGHGFIWKEVMNQTGHKFDITPIDIRDDKTSPFLKGDNIKFLMSLDLSKYDVIDLDAYGVPFQQMEIIFQKQFKGIVHVTFIQSGMGSLNRGMLSALGYTKEMVKKCPTLFSRNGYEKFKNYLSIRSILSINELSLNRKHYLYFKT